MAGRAGAHLRLLRLRFTGEDLLAGYRNRGLYGKFQFTAEQHICAWPVHGFLPRLASPYCDVSFGAMPRAFILR